MEKNMRYFSRIDEIEDIMTSLESELNTTAYDKGYAHIREFFLSVLDDYSILFEKKDDHLEIRKDFVSLLKYIDLSFAFLLLLVYLIQKNTE